MYGLFLRVERTAPLGNGSARHVRQREARPGPLVRHVHQSGAGRALWPQRPRGAHVGRVDCQDDGTAGGQLRAGLPAWHHSLQSRCVTLYYYSNLTLQNPVNNKSHYDKTTLIPSNKKNFEGQKNQDRFGCGIARGFHARPRKISSKTFKYFEFCSWDIFWLIF